MRKNITEAIKERILVLDGAMGTMLQREGLTESDFRGSRFADHKTPLAGCNDILTITRPDVIAAIHKKYLAAGADIIETNSFNSNSLSLHDYNLEELVYELNRAAAELARGCADEFSTDEKPRYVAGSVGPTSKMCSMSADVLDAGARSVTFDELVATYSVQVRGMIDGGVDLFLVETVFDTLNCKAALYAIEKVCNEVGVRIPIMVSGTITDNSGRVLSGQTVEAFYASVSHANLLTVGLNCAFGAEQMRPYIARLKSVATCGVSAHPNAGLPNGMGGYDQTPGNMAAVIEEYLAQGLLNIVGGCCGTSPEYITEIARVAARHMPPENTKDKHITTLSGLDVLNITPELNFVNIGERCNVAGSAKFARLIRDGKFEEAVAVAREQVESGAQIVDLCMDDGMINGVEAMTKFINLIAAEPDIARVPLMIDSSSWDVLEAGLKCCQGKAIVNSISLKEGESEFIRKALKINSYGAAAVVMLFDERGQADTYERKIEVAGRAYKTLVTNGFKPENIIFDPNVLAVATGIAEHNSYGIDFIRCCEWIKNSCPYAKVSGGVSNLSFSFRGNNTVREAMHSAFLYHARGAGMDMGIVNASMLQIYSDIPAQLKELVEDVILNRHADATEKLSTEAEKMKGETGDVKSVGDKMKWRELPVEERIMHALIKGLDEFVAEDSEEAYQKLGSPLAVIDSALMVGMKRVGELFGSGQMFLPQVVKSARVMKKAVAYLTPYIEQGSGGEGQSMGKVLLATVKGDVHDIGKNIVSVVVACNGYSIIDLGVMVSAEDIVNTAIRENVDAIGLSGLITPSLEEMITVVKELQNKGLDIPVMIGGATTSPLHTAVKIAPHYRGAVIQLHDASQNPQVLSKLCSPQKAEYIATHKAEQERIRREYELSNQKITLRKLSEARANRAVMSEWKTRAPQLLGNHYFENFPIAEVIDYIDWIYFFKAWGITGRMPQIFDHPEKGVEARKLYDDAIEMLNDIIEHNLLILKGVVGIYPANSKGDDILVYPEITCRCTTLTLPQLRNQELSEERNTCLSDFVRPLGTGNDFLGFFALTSGIGLTELEQKYRKEGDDYKAIMIKLLADRLVEAFAERVHELVRKELWGYAADENLSKEDLLRHKYVGIRPALGYPCCPNHADKAPIMKLLGADRIGMELTESFMMSPTSSVSGYFFANPDSTYFSVGKIDNEQFNDYAKRCGGDIDKLKKLISQNL